MTSDWLYASLTVTIGALLVAAGMATGKAMYEFGYENGVRDQYAVWEARTEQLHRDLDSLNIHLQILEQEMLP